MHESGNDPSRPIKLGLMTVVAFMSWPIWLAIISGVHHLTYGVWASVLIPIGVTACVPLLAIHGAHRLYHQMERAEHALHIDSLIHHHG